MFSTNKHTKTLHPKTLPATTKQTESQQRSHVQLLNHVSMWSNICQLTS